MKLTSTLTTLALLAPAAVAQLGVKIENTATTTSATYITVPYDASLVPTTGLTVEAWITYDETTVGPGWRWPTICRQNPMAGQESFWFRIQSGQNQTRRLALGTTTSRGLQVVNYDFAAGEFTTWTHVAATYDGSAMRLYVNGDLKATLTTVGPQLRNNGGPLIIGNGDTNAIENWNGELDEVRLWPVARTADEIKSTMNLALASVPGKVSTWNLDFTPGDSSNGNNGTNVGTVNYGTNTLRLMNAPLGGAAFATGTAGCNGTPAIGVTGHAKPGNSGFAITCLNSSMGGSLNLFWLGIAKLGTPVNINGASLWVAPGAGILLTGSADANRLTRIDAPLPASIPTGTKVYGQFIFAENGCSTPAFMSEGLEIEIQ